MRASVYGTIKFLESYGFECIISDFKTTDDCYGFGCAVLFDSVKLNTVSIVVSLSGITVTVSTRKSKDKIVINQKEVLTSEDRAKILFNLN